MAVCLTLRHRRLAVFVSSYRFLVCRTDFALPIGGTYASLNPLHKTRQKLSTKSGGMSVDNIAKAIWAAVFGQ